MSETRWQRQMRAIPGPIRFGVVAGALGLAGYWWATYSGLYRWLAELQIGWFEGYDLILTGVLTILFTLVPPVVLLGALAARLPAPKEGPRWDSDAIEAWIRANQGLLVAGLIGVGLLGFGVVQLARSALYGSLTTVELASLEKGEPPPSRFVELEGAPLWGMSVGVEGEHQVTWFTPLQSKPTGPVALLLEVDARQLEFGSVNRAQKAYKGTLSTSVSGLARTALTTKGVPLAEPTWVLDVGHSPGETRSMGFAFSAMGAVSVAVFYAWILFRRRRARGAPRTGNS